MAETLAKTSPGMTFVYVSGAGTDSTEQGRSMWARVKGRTENALLRLPFKGAYMFRPGMIQPLHGIKSKTGLYRAVYAVTGPLLPLLKAVAPKHRDDDRAARPGDARGRRSTAPTSGCWRRRTSTRSRGG